MARHTPSIQSVGRATGLHISEAIERRGVLLANGVAQSEPRGRGRDGAWLGGELGGDVGRVEVVSDGRDPRRRHLKQQNPSMHESSGEIHRKKQKQESGTRANIDGARTRCRA